MSVIDLPLPVVVLDPVVLDTVQSAVTIVPASVQFQVTVTGLSYQPFAPRFPAVTAG